MSDILLAIFVTPLQLIYEWLYNFAVKMLGGNYGLGLFALSIITSVLLIPLERWVSGQVKAEKEIEEVLSSQIVEIKNKYKGEEQQQAISRLYSRYSYNPVYSIRSALTVLVQLPFLFGAFWMISSYTPIKGVSFGPITDLSLPDGWLWGVNLLPFVMTAVNLSTVALLPNLNKRNQLQAIVIAVLFLVILYNAPSALLVYWTCNNVIMLIKASFRRFYKAPPMRFNLQGWFFGIPKATRISFIAFLIGVLLFFVEKKDYFSHYTIIFNFFSDCIFISILSYLSFPYILLGKNRGLSKNTITNLFIVFVLLFSIVRVLNYWGLGDGRDKLSIQLVISILLVWCFSHKDFVIQRFKNFDIGRAANLYWSSVFALASAIALYFPLTLYFSDVNAFDTPVKNIVIDQLIIFEIILFIAFIVYLSLNRPAKGVLSFLLSLIAIIAFTFGFVLSPDYGVIDAFQLQRTDSFSNKYNRLKDTLVFVTSLSLLLGLLLLKKERIIKYFLYFLTVPLIALTGFKCITYLNNKSNTNYDTIPYDVQDMFKFSKTGSNIVIVMLDTFTGGHIKNILSEHPDLTKSLDGFIWYPDTVAGGSSTIWGKPGILGGASTLPLELNKKKGSLEEKINQNWGLFLKNLQNNDFKISIHDDVWLKPDLLKKHVSYNQANIVPQWNLWEKLSNRWAKKHHYTATNLNVPIYKFMISYALFKISPLSYRHRIYSDGTWKGTVKKSDNRELLAFQRFSILDSYTSLSSTVDSGNRFIFVSDMTNHHPWSLDENCLPSKKYLNDTKEAHIQTEYCSLKSLSSWFSWMKENGVYDNSHIILVSDHEGFNDSDQMAKAYPGYAPLKCDPCKTNPHRVHALLLDKPISSRGDLTVNSKYLMGNWDVTHLIWSQAPFINKNVDKPWLNPSRLRCQSIGEWRRDRQQIDKYTINRTWCVKGTMFQKENWYELKNQ